MAVSGEGGRARVGANVVAEVETWELNAEVEMLETTSLGVDGRTYIPGLFGADGSIDARWNMGDTNGQRALQNAFFNKTSVALALAIGAFAYTGTAFISTLNVTNEVDGVVEATFDFQFTGAVAFA